MGCGSEASCGPKWLEIAHQAWPGAWARTFTDQEQRVGGWITPCASSALDALDGGDPGVALTSLIEVGGAAPETSAFILAEREGYRISLRRRGDLPDPVWVRAGQVIPIAWEAGSGGFASAQLEMADGDFLAAVSAGYLRATGLDEERLADAVRRWIETGTDATQLGDCLARTGQRLAQARETSLEGGALLVARSRPLASATVWTGPPSDPAQDHVLLGLLMAETGTRIICGDTTAQIAARLLGRELTLDRRELAQAAVPPSAHLEGVHLVTEGLVTLRHAAEWLRGARTVRDLPRNVDASTRLAQRLMAADEVRFLVGRAVNPVQAEGEAGLAPLRLAAVSELVACLRTLGKVVEVQYF